MWSIWGTNVWKCFPIRTEGGGICKLLLPHGSSSLPILIVMRPARASSAAGRCHGPAGHAVCQLGQRGSARLGSARHSSARHGSAQHPPSAPHRPAPHRPARLGSARSDPPGPGRAPGQRGVVCVPIVARSRAHKNKNISIKGYNDHY